LQQSALNASAALERAHDIYCQSGDAKDIRQAFSALDAQVIQLKDERRTEKINGKFVNFKTDFKRDLAVMFRHAQSVENPEMLAAMTKGLLIDGLEKQNVSPEKIGINSEKLSEISRTITLAMTGDKKREQIAAQEFTPREKSRTLEQADYNHLAQAAISAEKQHTPNKTRQIEHTR